MRSNRSINHGALRQLHMFVLRFSLYICCHVELPISLLLLLRVLLYLNIVFCEEIVTRGRCVRPVLGRQQVKQEGALGLLKDLKRDGYALTCCSYPKSDLVMQLQEEDDVS